MESVDGQTPASLDLIRAESLHSVQCHGLHERTSMGHGQKMGTDQAIRQ